jgi:phospho-N-acetylmuramoyl-pentapeptide-transferase
MLYHLLYPLKYIFSPVNIFQYITFRAGGAILTSLVLCFAVGPAIIRLAASKKINQEIRHDGPQTHLAKKGTPTMGGLIIIISLIISTLLWARLDNRFVWILLGSVVVLGFLGFMDDAFKILKRDSNGVSAVLKLLVQGLLAASIAGYLYFNPSNADYATLVNIPYFKELYVNVWWLYPIFIIVTIVGASNAVNLTDGQDGLAIGGIIFAAVTYIIFSYCAGNIKIAEYLRIIYVPGAGEITVFLAAMVGASVGFLWYNAYPAEIFMGDTGSLFLGGALGIVAVFIRQELLLIIVGGVFVAESVSVMLQVGSYKIRKKRIFRMAPLHHHFEIGGLQEPKITVRFWIVCMMLSLIALASLKVR